MDNKMLLQFIYFELLTRCYRFHECSNIPLPSNPTPKINNANRAQARNQKFFGAGEISWNRGTSTNASRTA